MRIEVEHGDALQVRADVLALKYAQSLYGVDQAVFRCFLDKGRDLSSSLPAVSEYRLIDSRDTIAASAVLFVGVQPLPAFGYAEIQAFGHDVLDALAQVAPETQHLCITIHGAGYGLDETLAFRAELQGFADAICSGEFPEQLKRITVIERISSRVERLKSVLAQVAPGKLTIVRGLGVANDEAGASLLPEGLDFAGYTLSNTVTSTNSGNDQTLSRQCLQDIIARSVQLLSNIVATEAGVLGKCTIQTAQETLQEIESLVGALGRPLDVQSRDGTAAIRDEILPTLVSLRVSTEVAGSQLESSEQKELGQYLYLVGMSVLVASYSFLGQDVPPLKNKLQGAVREVQTRLLNEIALELIPKNAFPWERVPQLLSPTETKELLLLYRSAVESGSQ